MSVKNFPNGVRLVPQADPPSDPREGQTYYDNGTNRDEGIYTYNGTSWVGGLGNLTASNEGTGEGVFKQKSTDNLEFKSLAEGDGIQILSFPNEISIESLVPTVGSTSLDEISSDTVSTNTSIFLILNTGTIPVGVYSYSATIVFESNTRGIFYNQNFITVNQTFENTSGNERIVNISGVTHVTSGGIAILGRNYSSGTTTIKEFSDDAPGVKTNIRYIKIRNNGF